jgi:hypothetical protein
MFKKEKLFKITFILSTVILIASICFKLGLCSSLAVKNSELEDAFVYKKGLEDTILALSIEDSNLSSIEYVESRAKAIGFIEMTDKMLSINPEAPIQVAVLTQR